MANNLRKHHEFEARFNVVVNLKHVQVRVDTVTTCACVLDYWKTRDGVPMTKLELLDSWTGTGHFPNSRIKDCSGVDGRCRCAGEVGASVVSKAESANACAVGASLRRASAAGVCEVPNGNHGDNNFSASTATC